MASNDVKSSATNMDRVHKSQTAASPNTQDQTLLKALHAFIIPLIRAVDQTKEIDINQITLGPEAGKLITALQEFISSVVVRAQSDPLPTTIEVNLVDDENVLHTDGDGDGDIKLRATRAEGHSHALGELTIVQQNSDVVFHDKLMKALREHVFNKMPIRLLYIEPRRFGFQISLLERGAIYGQLESVFREKLRNHDKDFQHHYYGSTGWETDEEAITRLISNYVRYAILSHTWLRTTPGEVTFSDWNKGSFGAKDPGHQKLVNFCKVSWKIHGLAFGWMDTVCINKESSSELDESIRSMYNWYSRAYVCITYLAETGMLHSMHLDPWFTRGWTLQELLAPDVIKFYDRDWNRLVETSENDKVDMRITVKIKHATTISEEELTNIHTSPISRRMQLAAPREVTREEDTAYSLMGIFNVSISTAYGEGAERAFFRLLQEILLSSTNTLDIFNWAGELPLSKSHSSESGMLPPSPKYYANRSFQYLSDIRVAEPLTYTHLGLRVQVILMPGFQLPPSNQSRYCDPFGDYYASVTFNVPPGVFETAPYVSNVTYNLLDKRVFDPAARKQNDNGLHQGYQSHTTFAVFNFKANATAVDVSKTCNAKGLICSEDPGKVVGLGARRINILQTMTPIVFELQDLEGSSKSRFAPYFRIRRDELHKHGMQLVTLYL